MLSFPPVKEANALLRSRFNNGKLRDFLHFYFLIFEDKKLKVCSTNNQEIIKEAI